MSENAKAGTPDASGAAAKPGARDLSPTLAPCPADLEGVRAYFARDRFASERLGARVDEAAPGHAVVSCDIVDELRNGTGAVMGGAIFTLADFAGAVASMCGRPVSVTLASEVRYLTGARGTRLIATCDADRSGHRVGFYTTRVEDDLGTLVAVVTSTSMCVGEPRA